MTLRAAALVLVVLFVFVAGNSYAQRPQTKKPSPDVSSQHPSKLPPSPSGVKFISGGTVPGLPFSAGVQVGPMIYLSGQIGTDSSGKLVSGGIAAETRQAMENIRTVLEKNGSSMDDIVKCTMMLADMPADFDNMNKVYRTFFREGRYPARSSFGASALALGARVEIECWARKR